MEDFAPSLPKKTGFRSLRIAWSVLAAAACICVLALWVRSFMFNEGWFVMRNGYWYKLWSIRGGLSVNFNVNNGPIPYFWRFYHKKIPDDYEDPPSNLGFRFVRFDPNGAKHTYGPKDFSRIPYWPFMFLAAAVGTVPWIRWSFSLRTMMIAG